MALPMVSHQRLTGDLRRRTGEWPSGSPVESEWINFFEIRPSTFFSIVKDTLGAFHFCFELNQDFKPLTSLSTPLLMFQLLAQVCLGYLLEQSVTWIEPDSDDDLHSPKASLQHPEEEIWGGGTWTTHGSTSIIAAVKMGKTLTQSIYVKGSSVEILKLVTPSENGWFQFYSTKNTHTYININMNIYI